MIDLPFRHLLFSHLLPSLPLLFFYSPSFLPFPSLSSLFFSQSQREGPSGSGSGGDKTSTQILCDLEISLRTNNIEWVYNFLDSDGLEALVNYMTRLVRELVM